MRLVSFRLNNSLTTKIGAIQGHKIVDLAMSYCCFLYTQKNCEWEAANRISQTLLPSSMVEFLEGGDASKDAANQAIEFAKEKFDVVEGKEIMYDGAEVFLLAPIPKPRSLRDFISFEEHIRNARKLRNQSVPPAWYEIPVYYKGSTETIIGPNSEVKWPNYSEKLDYELELAVVIGKSGINIPVEKAEEYIAGFMIMNDFSARDIQAKEMSVGLGPAKGKDFATAFGPYFVTKDEISDPYNLQMIARVNGEEWSKGNSGTIHRTFAELISYVSQSERIYPGEVLGSGTVGSGCGLELGRFLKPGDQVELEIEQLGTLSNKIVRQEVSNNI